MLTGGQSLFFIKKSLQNIQNVFTLMYESMSGG